MVRDDTATVAAETGIDAAVIERTVERSETEVGRLSNALVVLHAELVGRHSNLEHERAYVTVDGTRAYRVDEAVWDDFLAEFDFAPETEAAARYAHTEQARLLFATAVGGDDDFEADEEGVVIGIDTAEQF